MFVCKAIVSSLLGAHQREVNLCQGTWQPSISLSSPVFHSPHPPTPQTQGAQSREPGVLHTRGSPHTSEPLHRLFPLLAMPFLTLSFWRTSTQPSQTNSNNNPRTPLHHCPKLKRWPLFWVHSSPCKRLNRDLVT